MMFFSFCLFSLIQIAPLSAITPIAETPPLPLHLEDERESVDRALHFSPEDKDSDDDGKYVPLPSEKQMEELEKIKEENEAPPQSPEDMSCLIGTSCIHPISGDKEALVIYVSKEKMQGSSFSPEVMNQTLENLSEKYEIYISPTNYDDMLWAAEQWPYYRMMMQPKGGTSFENARLCISSLLRVGHKKVGVVLQAEIFFPSEYIASGFDLLQRSDVVIGPLAEGGFYLLSASREIPKIHDGIADPSMFNDIRTVLEQHRISLGKLPLWSSPKKSALAFSEKSAPNFLLEKWTEQAKVSIIIPICNEESIITQLVTQLRSLTPTPERIFVDRGSNDRTVEILRSFNEKVFYAGANALRGTAFNEGVKVARGNYFLFLHPQCHLSQNGYQEMLKKLENEEIEAGAFSLHLASERRNELLRVVETTISLRSRLFKMPYGNQGYFITKKAFSVVGPYQEMHTLEDVEWFSRMKKSCSYAILQEPIGISAKQASQGGFIRKGIKNCCLISLYKIGVKPERLSKVPRN